MFDLNATDHSDLFLAAIKNQSYTFRQIVPECVQLGRSNSVIDSQDPVLDYGSSAHDRGYWMWFFQPRRLSSRQMVHDWASWNSSLLACKFLNWCHVHVMHLEWLLHLMATVVLQSNKQIYQGGYSPVYLLITPSGQVFSNMASNMPTPMKYSWENWSILNNRKKINTRNKQKTPGNTVYGSFDVLPTNLHLVKHTLVKFVDWHSCGIFGHIQIHNIIQHLKYLTTSSLTL